MRMFGLSPKHMQSPPSAVWDRRNGSPVSASPCPLRLLLFHQPPSCLLLSHPSRLRSSYSSSWWLRPQHPSQYPAPGTRRITPLPVPRPPQSRLFCLIFRRPAIYSLLILCILVPLKHLQACPLMQHLVNFPFILLKDLPSQITPASLPSLRQLALSSSPLYHTLHFFEPRTPTI